MHFSYDKAELLDLFSLNLHRIEKDVQRCDRNFWYFTKENLEKLRNVMCTYVWERLEDVGYVQGMCDLAAPLLVIFDDGKTAVITFTCLHQMYFVHHHRGFNVQLLYQADGENDRQLSEWRCDGYTFCQYAIADTNT